MNLYVVLILYVFIVQMITALHAQGTMEESLGCINPACIHHLDDCFAHTTDWGTKQG